MLQKTHDCPKIKYEIRNKSLKCDTQQNHNHSVKQIKNKEKKSIDELCEICNVYVRETKSN